MKVPYSRDLVKRIDDACAERKRRAILIAEDPEGRRHAGVYIVWDQNSAYYIMGGGDPELRNSGATSLCMWEAIKLASTVTKAFDFEGSMLEPVERFFRGFGASQVPYFSITKTPSKLLKTYFFLQDLRRKG
ncbi:Acetyltransferase (GNAT) domain protein [compost metagenome]